jgi:hypothetical protein
MLLSLVITSSCILFHRLGAVDFRPDALVDTASYLKGLQEKIPWLIYTKRKDDEDESMMIIREVFRKSLIPFIHVDLLDEFRKGSNKNTSFYRAQRW